MSLAANTGQSTYTLIYVALSAITVILVPLVFLLIRSFMHSLNENMHGLQDNTRETARLANVVSAIETRVASNEVVLQRHERSLEYLERSRFK